MSNARLILLIAVLFCGWLIYQQYGKQAAESVINDVQAYQSRSLLPEDN